jgi:histidinol phosphatase-like enzyme
MGASLLIGDQDSDLKAAAAAGIAAFRFDHGNLEAVLTSALDARSASPD